MLDNNTLFQNLHHKNDSEEMKFRAERVLSRLASVGILGKEREPGVGKLGWHGNFDTGFERKTV